VYLLIYLIMYISILLMKTIEIQMLVYIHIDKTFHGSSRIHVKSIGNRIVLQSDGVV